MTPCAENPADDVLIVGAGPAGLALAIALLRTAVLRLARRLPPLQALVARQLTGARA